MALKFHYKWPTASKTSTVQQAIMTNKKTGEEVSTSTDTINLGTATVIFYFATFFYVYVSGAIKKNNIKKLSDITNLFVFPSENSGSIFNLNTLSSSFENSERIGTTVCLVVFLALLQTLFSYQNIYTKDPKQATIVSFNYLVVLSWLLFLYIFPSYKDSKTSNTDKTSINHLVLAFVILISMIVNSFLIVDLYSEYFDDKTLEPLIGIKWAIIAIAIFAGITMIPNVITKSHLKNLSHLSHELVAYAEMACLILFGIFLIIFIQFPPLPSGQLSCVMIPNSTPQPSTSPVSSS